MGFILSIDEGLLISKLFIKVFRKQMHWMNV